MVSVQVLYKSSGRPARHVRVCIAFSGLLRSVSKDVYTDADGEAHFTNDPGQGIIYVNSNRVFEGRVEGRKIVYV